MTSQAHINTSSHPHPNWGALIFAKRTALEESQADFGRRFGVSQVAVAYWESGKNDPPGEVTWWLMNEVAA